MPERREMATTFRIYCENHRNRIVMDRDELFRLVDRLTCMCCEEELVPEFPHELWCRVCDKGW